ncbi:aliphatic sulfonate ABC transporter substrate-binding protein [Methyloferula stellata]|uniref:aliphatic sulfonate ABC transporter substrate-binding protein n=1 Tax=Methyloferula stellata TaxID=876270 RepID=UPI000368B136|nr:aliphatic sulfonate ABC transporter substrate-binding protein [Methyloferula stellata]
MQRRQALQLFGAVLALATFGKAAAGRAAGGVKEIRIGYQKAGISTVIKQRQTLEAAFRPQGIGIQWVEFAFGPPILEGINTGNLDFGFTGDTPPIFAQAATPNLVYVATLPEHYAEGIVVQDASPIKSLADLKGKKIGFGKASSAHATLLYALEKAGLAYSDIEPVYLAPADALAAFTRGSIDAWSIWDPYLSIAQTGKVRVIAYAADVRQANTYFLANKDFAANSAATLSKLLDAIAIDTRWAGEHHAEAAQAIHDASGIDLQAIRTTIDRSNFVVRPTTDADAAIQQGTADRFLKIGLLPKPIKVSEIVWKWTPST